jgi:hypothetical protein
VKRGIHSLVQSRRQIVRTDRIPQERGSLRRIQEPECRTEKIKSLVYVVLQIILAPQGESPNKSSYQIRNPLITCRVTRKHATIYLLKGIPYYMDIYRVLKLNFA